MVLLLTLSSRWLGCLSTASASGAINIPVAWGLAIAEYVWWIALGERRDDRLRIVLSDPLAVALGDQSHRRKHAAVGGARAPGCMPIMHLGRPGLFYWLFPYSNVMGVWPQVRSPLWWDFICLLCYILMSIMYYYAGLLPDFATVRDLAPDPVEAGLLRQFSLSAGAARPGTGATSASSMRSCRRSWRRWSISVHSVVGLDFAGGLTPGWHDTQFPPYFFFGAVISGAALIIMLTILVRWGYSLQDVITEYHLNALAKVMLVGKPDARLCLCLGSFRAALRQRRRRTTEFFARIFGFYAGVLLGGKYLTVVIPQLLWLPAVRRSEILLFLISGGIIVGMWLERFVFVIAKPRAQLHAVLLGRLLSDILGLGGAWREQIGLFLTLFFLFLRFVPIVSMSEVREIIEEKTGK